MQRLRELSLELPARPERMLEGDRERPLVWDELAARLHPGEADELARRVGRSRIDENATLSAELSALLEIHAELIDGNGELLARERLLRSLEPPGRETVAHEIAAYADALRERGGLGGSAVAAHSGAIEYAQRCAAGELEPPARPGTAGSHSSASTSSRPASRASSCSTALALQFASGGGNGPSGQGQHGHGGQQGLLVGPLRPATSGGRRPHTAAPQPLHVHGDGQGAVDDAEATAGRVAAAFRGGGEEILAGSSGAKGGSPAAGGKGAQGKRGGGAGEDVLAMVAEQVVAALASERESLLKMVRLQHAPACTACSCRCCCCCRLCCRSMRHGPPPALTFAPACPRFFSAAQAESVRLWIDDEAAFSQQLASAPSAPSLEQLRHAKAELEAALLSGRGAASALAAPLPEQAREPLLPAPGTPPRRPLPAIAAAQSTGRSAAEAPPRPGRTGGRRVPQTQPQPAQPAHGQPPASRQPQPHAATPMPSPATVAARAPASALGSSRSSAALAEAAPQPLRPRPGLRFVDRMRTLSLREDSGGRPSRAPVAADAAG